MHDLTTARICGVVRALAAGSVTLADKGYIGAGQRILVPYRGRGKPPSQKAANSAYARLRALAVAPTPSSRQVRSWISSAAAPGAPDTSPRPSTSCEHARSADEKAHVLGAEPACHQARFASAGRSPYDLPPMRTAHLPLASPRTVRVQHPTFVTLRVGGPPVAAAGPAPALSRKDMITLHPADSHRACIFPLV
jgi:hypothetical protein